VNRLLCAVLLAAAMIATAAEGSAGRLKLEPAIQDKDKGSWIELFNGKDLTGWKHIGPGDFTVEDGALVSHGGMGMLYYEAKSFRDFTLEVEWKVRHKCNNSGIFVRFPEKSDDPRYAVDNGYEIQIDDCAGKYQTGAIYDQRAPTKVASKPAGEWNKYEITIVGQRYTIVLNGEKVNEFEGQRGRTGYIGLQNHDPISQASFRKVRVREIE
jgi:hypothetical protein